MGEKQTDCIGKCFTFNLIWDFNYIINLSVEYYYNLTTDLLLPRPIPGSSGFSSVWSNVGSLYNRGLELMLGTENLKGSFTWNTDLNLSLNQTLSRTIITSGTTLIVVLSLYIFGGDVINTFAFVLLVGILVGTYSSIFVASPVALSMHKVLVARRERRRLKGRR